MKHLILLSIFSVAALSACSSGDRGAGRIAQCGSKWKILPLDRKAEQKTDLSTGEPNLAAGRYDVSTTVLYYWDKEADIKLQVAAKADDETGETKFDVGCVSGRGIHPKMETMAMSVPYVSNMIVDESGKTILTTKSLQLTFSVEPGQPLLKMKSEEVSKDTQGSIKNTYDQYDSRTHKLFKVNAKNIETRTQLRASAPGKNSDDSLDVRISVAYVKDRPEEQQASVDAPVAPEQN